MNATNTSVQILGRFELTIAIVLASGQTWHGNAIPQPRGETSWPYLISCRDKALFHSRPVSHALHSGGRSREVCHESSHSTLLELCTTHFLLSHNSRGVWPHFTMRRGKRNHSWSTIRPVEAYRRCLRVGGTSEWPNKHSPRVMPKCIQQ